MEGYLYAFTDAVDATLSNSADKGGAMKKVVPLRLLTDSKQVFDIITGNKRLTERLLAFDVATARDSYQKVKIDAAGLVRGAKNSADAVTRLKHNGGLDQILNTYLDSTPM